MRSFEKLLLFSLTIQDYLQLSTAVMARNSGNDAIVSIAWPCDSIVASKKQEARVSQVLHRKNEWGRGRDLPQHRQDEISRACDTNGMTMYQALSLRRSMLRAMPGGMRRVSRSSAMGSNQGQQTVASLLEAAVLNYVKLSISRTPEFEGKSVDEIEYSTILRTEAEQLQEMRVGRRRNGPTPDVLLLRPIKINGEMVKWIDAKMYYASALLANKSNIPNGKLQQMALRYNDFFGCEKGAFVFGRSFCADIRRIVNGALLLDSTPLDMTEIERFQDEQA